MFVHVQVPFHTQTSFSALELGLEAYTDKSSQFRVAVKMEDLFKVEVTPDDLDVLKFLNNCRSSPWPPYPLPSVPKSEKTVLLALISKIFVHICKEVVLEQPLPVPMPCPVKVDYLGMGTVKTWHGTPDARVKGVDIISRKKE